MRKINNGGYLYKLPVRANQGHLSNWQKGEFYDWF